VLLHGVQVSDIKSNKFISSPAVIVRHTVGEPVTKISDNEFVDTPELVISELYSDKVDTAHLSGNVYRSSK